MPDEWTMTMRCALHGIIQTLVPPPGTAPSCPTCSDEEWRRNELNSEGLAPIRDQLDRIEAMLERLHAERRTLS